MVEQLGICIAVVSGKGGTGKTSFTAGVGASLARLGYRTLCMDCDTGLRNLDMALGLTDCAMMDFTDVAQGRCSLENAITCHPQSEQLFLLTAPARNRIVQPNEMRRLLKRIRRSFDYCLLDAPAGLGTGFQLAVSAVDRAVVVTTAERSALRDAQRTVMELSRFPRGTLHVVVNRVRRRMLRQLHATIDDAIDTAGLPLLGVVPEDNHLAPAMNQGTLLYLSDARMAANAYRNIARRLTGQRVPLMRIR